MKNLKRNKKAKIIERIVENKKLLLDRGFLSTLIETEDIHLKRRAKEAESEFKIRNWANEK